MNSGNNEDLNEGNIPSIRLKYKGGKGGKSKINYGAVTKTSKRVISSGDGSKTIKEEKVIIKQESKSSRGLDSSPLKSNSKITTKTVIQGGDTTKSSQKITITKTEITEESKSSRARSGQKELIGSTVTKTTEQTSTNNNNRSGSQGRNVREEVTTKTTTTTTINNTNQSGRGQSTGKEEVVKTVTSNKTESTSQRRVRGGKEEVTETKTTTTNQSQRSRGTSQGQKEQVVKEVTQTTSINRRNAPNQKQETTTKTVTTAKVGESKKETYTDAKARAATLAPSSTSQIKVDETVSRGRTGLRSEKKESSNQRSLIAQKSTPALRVSKESNTKVEEKEKRPKSSRTEMSESRDNIIRITINDTGKIPKKTYILNVRKLDRIQQNKRQRLLYSSNLEKLNPVKTNFNHNIIMINNVKKEANYSSKTNIPNTIQIFINESGKIPKKQVVVSPRKYEVIKSIKKPLKFTYENYVETNTSNIQTGINKIPLPSGKKTETINSTRIKTEGIGNKTTTTTTTTTETKMRIGRNKSEANMNKGGTKESKVTVTKTEISTERQGGKPGRLQVSGDKRNITENSGSTTEQKTTTVRESSRGTGGKVETVTTKEVVTKKGGSKSRLGEEGADSKVTTVKKIEISTSGDNNGGRSKSRIKQETSSTTTTTTKIVTKTESNVEPVEGKSVLRKFKSTRRMKK